VIRNLFYSLVGRPDLALGGQLLHGPTFSALWSSGVNYSMEVAPKELGASAQALYGGVYFSLAGAIGALIGGRMYATAGPAALFQVAAGIAVVGMVLIVTGREKLAVSYKL
jgi:predicted MFS family arabinose efflux permease